MNTFAPAKGSYHAYVRELAEKNPDADLRTLQKLAALGNYATQQGVSSDMYETPEQMLEDLQAKRANEAAARQQAVPPRPAAPAPRAPVQIPQQQGGSAMFNPYQQMGMQRGMASDVMGAIGNELDSRVAQGREYRRQEHEKSLLNARSDAELKILIERLKHERYMAERQMQMMREMEDRKRGVLFNSAWSKSIPYR
jgi:hypothetical protein